MQPKSLILAALLAVASPTHALFGVGDIVHDPINLVQNAMTATHMAESLLNEAEQIENQIRQINDMIAHGERITNPQWSEIKDLLNQLSSVTAQGDALAYSMPDLDDMFKAAFPGYQPPTDWGTEYEVWTRRGLDTIKGVLNGLGIQHQEMASEQDRLKAIQSLSDGAVGRMQALQVGNMIANEQAQQMVQLRQLIMMQTNAQSVYYAHQINTKAAAEANLQRWLNAPRDPVPAYGSRGFGAVPTVGK